MRHAQGYALVLGSVAILAGCGGGGDGGTSGSATAVPLSTVNYASVTETAVQGVSDMSAFSSSTDLIVSTSAVGAAGAADSVSMLAGGPVQLARFALSHLGQTHTGLKAQAQAAVTEDVSCEVSGSLRLVDNDADGNNLPSRGDSVTLIATNCVSQVGQAPVSGQMALVLGAVTLDSANQFAGGTITLSFTNFTSDGAALNGSADLTFDSSAVVLDFNRLTATYGSQSSMVDYRLTVYADSTAVVEGPVGLNGSVYTLSTPSRIALGSTHPTAGMLRIADGQGNRVDVLMGSLTYTASLYLRGDETLDARSTVAW